MDKGWRGVSAGWLLLGLVVTIGHGSAGTTMPSASVTVHVVPHSHDDPGWLETEDLYYTSKVEAILTNTVAALTANASRVFHQVEMVYFRRWYLNQTAGLRRDVAGLVAAGRLVFLSGGLCMNDEATTHAATIVDQMSWGHRFIAATFGPEALPTVGWQIDSFGHSAGYAALIAAMGLDAVVGQKIDHQDHDRRAADRELEFEWQGASDPTQHPPILGHLLYDNTEGYSYVLEGSVIDDPAAPGYNIEEVVAGVAQSVADRRSRYGHPNDVLMLYGTDFWFQTSPTPFEKMEKVMRFVNNRPTRFGFRLAYSTPAAYFKAVRTAAAPALPRYHGDFFPAAFSAHYIRSGFFSSRPAQKNSDRMVWARGHAAQLLQAVASPDAATAPGLATAIAAVDAAVGVHQHHDAMSGTDLASVAEDYARKLSLSSASVGPPAASAAATMSGVVSSQAGATCDLANISVCDPMLALSHNQGVTVVVFNPLGVYRTELVEIPVPIPGVSAVDLKSKQPIQSEVHCAVFHGDVATVGRRQNWTVFVRIDNLGPLEARAIRIMAAPGRSPVPSIPLTTGGAVAMGDAVTVNTTSGGIVSARGLNISSTLRFYTPNMADNRSHSWGGKNPCSSAYAFRPLPGDAVQYPTGSTKVTLSNGTLVRQTVARISIGPGAGGNHIIQVNRLLQGDPAVHIITQLGPLDVNNGIGQETILRFGTGLRSNATWETDANGLRMMRRQRRARNTSTYNVTEPVAQNYFPVTSSATLQDDVAGRGLSLAFDAAHGVSSLADGDLEVMLHRRLVDNGCRTDEGYEMDDRHSVIQRVRLQAGPVALLPTFYRPDAQKMLHPIQLYWPGAAGHAVSPGDGGPHTTNHAGVPPVGSLPANVHLFTLRRIPERGADLLCDPFELAACTNSVSAPAGSGGRTKGTLLLRLQHLFDVGEGAALAEPVSVDIARFLAPRWLLARLDETTLTAGRVIAADAASPVIELRPLQIRTFLVSTK